MNLISCEKLEKSNVAIQFSINAATLADAAAKAFKRESKKYSVPGFRKGKAPRGMIERMYGADVFLYDAVNDLFPAEYEAAVKAANVEVVGQPEPEVVSLSVAEGAVLKVTVPVKPEVTLGDYVGLKATKTVNTVEESAVDAELGRMQDRNARQLTREDAAENGDIANIDFEGFVDGVAFDGGKGEKFDLTLGSGSFIPGFEEQIVSHKAGDEFDIEVKFPDDYAAEELKGKTAIFKIKLNEVKYKELPALDDDFAKDVSEYDTLDELKGSIRKGMQDNLDRAADQDVENSLVDQVVNGMQAEVPQVMIENRVQELIQDFEYRLQQQGMNLKTYLGYMGMELEQFRAQFTEQAEKQVKMRLALEAVAAKEKIEATEEEVEAEIARVADMYKMEVDKVKAIIDTAAVKADLAVNKAIDFIKEKAEITAKVPEEQQAEEVSAVEKKAAKPKKRVVKKKADPVPADAETSETKE